MNERKWRKSDKKAKQKRTNIQKDKQADIDIRRGKTVRNSKIIEKKKTDRQADTIDGRWEQEEAMLILRDRDAVMYAGKRYYKTRAQNLRISHQLDLNKKRKKNSQPPPSLPPHPHVPPYTHTHTYRAISMLVIEWITSLNRCVWEKMGTYLHTWRVWKRNVRK